MAELAKSFPEGLRYDLCFDTTPFIRESINEVVRTLFAAVVLVAIVVLVFLQSWRSAMIPLVAVPVAIIGTFAVMAADRIQPEQSDAVRVGAGDRNRGGRCDRGGRGRRASYRGGDVAPRCDGAGDARSVGPGDRRGTGADGRVHALHIHFGHHRLVFQAIRRDGFGVDGHFGVQFADAQPGAGRDSAEADDGEERHSRRACWILRSAGFSGYSTGALRWATNGYLRVVGMMLRGSVIVLVLYGGLLLLTQWGFTQLPTGYLPSTRTRATC